MATISNLYPKSSKEACNAMAAMFSWAGVLHELHDANALMQTLNTIDQAPIAASLTQTNNSMFDRHNSTAHTTEADSTTKIISPAACKG